MHWLCYLVVFALVVLSRNWTAVLVFALDIGFAVNATIADVAEAVADAITANVLLLSLMKFWRSSALVSI